MNKSAMTIRRIVISGLLLSGVLTLQGCIEAVILGGAASGVLVISDRRQPDVMASDERIEIQIVSCDFSPCSKIFEQINSN